MKEEQALTFIRKIRGKKPFSEGGGRKVYEVDGYIIKKGKNKRGSAECEHEFWLYQNVEKDYQKYLCPIVYYEGDIVIMEKAKEVDFHDFETKYADQVEHVSDFFISHYGLDAYDLGLSFNWGIWNDNLVIVDYGLHQE